MTADKPGQGKDRMPEHKNTAVTGMDANRSL